jgi:hypothetical protein
VARFSIKLDQASDTRLRNNLRVNVEVVTGGRSGALVVRRGALGRSSTTHAFVVRGDEAVRVPVTFGMAGKETIEIEHGLSEGDMVVISNIGELEDVKQIRLKGRQQ